MSALTYDFIDALTGASINCTYPGLRALQIEIQEEPSVADAIFFPGCSFLNYALPLVGSVNDLLKNAGVTQGISLLCCGKILSYEEDGKAKRDAYEIEFREHLIKAGVKKIIAACPNCVKALRELLDKDASCEGIQVVPLPVVLAELGYRIDPNQASMFIKEQTAASGEIYGVDMSSVGEVYVAVHDSCPDRDTGEFADATRMLLSAMNLSELAHNRKRSLCCGSLVRAAGKFDAALKQSQARGNEGIEADAQALIASCMSCTYLLNKQQKRLPVFHYLELLFNWHIPWQTTDDYMKLRFLFEGSFGLFDTEGHPVNSGRPFVGLESN